MYVCAHRRPPCRRPARPCEFLVSAQALVNSAPTLSKKCTRSPTPRDRSKILSAAPRAHFSWAKSVREPPIRAQQVCVHFRQSVRTLYADAGLRGAMCPNGPEVVERDIALPKHNKRVTSVPAGRSGGRARQRRWSDAPRTARACQNGCTKTHKKSRFV